MTISDAVIRVEQLGKRYTLHHEKSKRYLALRDVVADGFTQAAYYLNPFKIASQRRRNSSQMLRADQALEEEFWALKDVNFEIRRGERIGIIGRNGAGKSTLLKILSRITEPTTGRVQIRGRVASLLEVGTGFHPELTGRENIYLNGAILGMSHREIRLKFDEIVSFAEVEKFLDTPVKRYSSGMYVRLAFAVAAHLEPEILIVDEVLSVGDAAFQRKCIGKMTEASSKDGTTVAFVSHNLVQLTSICDTGLLLENGKVKMHAGISDVISTYSKQAFNQNEANLSKVARPAHASQDLTFERVRIKHQADDIYEGDRLTVEIEYAIHSCIDEYILGVTISNSYQTLIECRSTAGMPALSGSPSTKNLVEVSLELPLKADTYNLNLGARSSKCLLDYVSSALQVVVLPRKDNQWEPWNQPSAGVIISDSCWNILSESELVRA